MMAHPLVLLLVAVGNGPQHDFCATNQEDDWQQEQEGMEDELTHGLLELEVDECGVFSMEQDDNQQQEVIHRPTDGSMTEETTFGQVQGMPACTLQPFDDDQQCAPQQGRLAYGEMQDG